MKDLFLKWSERPFEYGVSDCCQFVGECVARRHGANPASDFLYLGKQGADELVDSYGGLSALLTDVFGEPRDSGADGDVALIDDQQVVGYVHHDRIVAVAKSGLMDLPMARSSRFWTCRS